MIYIDTHQLENAEKEARNASTEFGRYSNDIRAKLQLTLSSYSGQRTSNITSAESRLRQKTNQVNRSSSSFSSFATKVNRYRSEVISKENSLKGEISRLFGSFAKRYNIQKSFADTIIDCINAVCQAIGLGDLGNLLRDFFYTLKAANDWARSIIKNWYYFDGGSEMIQAVVGIVAAVAGVILAVVAVITTAGVAAIVAASIVAAITVANAVVQTMKYAETFDPNKHVLDKNVSLKLAENASFTNELRRNGLYDWANFIDVVDAVASVVMVYDTFKSMAGTVGKKGKTLLDFIKDPKTKNNLNKLATDAKTFASGMKAAVSTYNMLTYRDYSNGQKSFADNLSAVFTEGADLIDFLFEQGTKKITTHGDNLKFDGDKTLADIKQDDYTGDKKLTSATGFARYQNKYYFPSSDGKTTRFCNAHIGFDIIKNTAKAADAVGKVADTISRQNVMIDNFSYNAKRGEKLSKNLDLPTKFGLPTFSYDATTGTAQLTFPYQSRYKLSDLSSPSKTVGATLSSIGDNLSTHTFQISFSKT